MPSKDLLNRSIDAGRDATSRTLEAGRDATQRTIEVGQRTGDRLEGLLRELLTTNLEQVEQAQHMLEEFIERSRKATEQFVELLDSEVRSQLGGIGVVSRADFNRLEARVRELEGAGAPGPAAPTKAPATRSPAKKASAKKASAKKAPAKKAPARKATAAK